MATVNQIEDNGGNIFDIEDTAAQTAIEAILNLIPNSATTSNKLATAQNVADEETRAKAKEAELLSKQGNYGKDSISLFDSNFKIAFQSAIDSAANYSYFSGGTDAGTEGAWVGFKHTAQRVGALIIRSDGLYFTSNASGSWVWKQII